MNYSQNNSPLVQKYYSTRYIKYHNIDKEEIHLHKKSP